MRRNAHLAIAASSIAIGALLLGTPGQAAVQAGQLACNVSGGPGLIVGSSRPLSCTFSGPAGPEHYVGSVSKLGVDIGYLAAGQMLWNVGRVDSLSRAGFACRQLQRATASAAVGPGVGANALIGGSSRSLTLQPVSVEGQSGLDVSGGLATINLQFAP